MTLKATLVASLCRRADAGLAAFPAQVGMLEVRADLVGDLDPETLRDRFAGRLLYTLRSRDEGGRFRGSEDERRERLARAALAFDLVDLEAERDLSPETLSAVPAERRLISWHGRAPRLPELKERFEAVSREEARIYKLVPFATRPGDELAPLQLLSSLRRDDVVAFAGGEQGVWTRLIAPRCGGPLVYGSAGAAEAAPGQPSIASLIRDFGLPELPEVEAIYGIVGDPVRHSLSPRLHNGAYAELGLPALYLPFQTESFADFWLEVVESATLEILGMPLRGLSVTSPFKAAALAVAGASSPLTECIGAANTLIHSAPVWEAESTDPDGVVLPLVEGGVELAGAPAAVFGCGGAGRAAAVGLAKAGARVTLVNRSEERGRRAAETLCLPFVLADEAEPPRYSILVNATPLGRGEQDPLPFELDGLGTSGGGVAVVDMVYGQEPTRLIGEAASRGLIAIGGREVLLGQARAQFRLMTGRDLPLATARRLLGLGGEEAAA